MSAMIRMKTPEYVEFHYPNETQQEKRERIVSIEQERSSDTYQVISLDK